MKFLVENGAFLPDDINDCRFNPPLHYCPGLEWAYEEMKRLHHDNCSSGETSCSSESWKPVLLPTPLVVVLPSLTLFIRISILNVCVCVLDEILCFFFLSMEQLMKVCCQTIKTVLCVCIVNLCRPWINSNCLLLIIAAFNWNHLAKKRKINRAFTLIFELDCPCIFNPSYFFSFRASYSIWEQEN